MLGKVRIKLKHMEIEIRRRETTGTGTSARNESETLAKYEIMDGAPVRGENIPIRRVFTPSECSQSCHSCLMASSVTPPALRMAGC